MVADLSNYDRAITLHPDTKIERWELEKLRAWRKDRHALSTEFFQDEIDGADTCLVALVAGQVAGIVWLYRSHNDSRLFALAKDEAEINSVFVLPEYRGRGLHRTLDISLCRLAKELGCDTIYGAVQAENEPSLRATRAAGFHETGEILHFMMFRPKYRRRRAA